MKFRSRAVFFPRAREGNCGAGKSKGERLAPKSGERNVTHCPQSPRLGGRRARNLARTFAKFNAFFEDDAYSCGARLRFAIAPDLTDATEWVTDKRDEKREGETTNTRRTDAICATGCEALFSAKNAGHLFNGIDTCRVGL